MSNDPAYAEATAWQAGFRVQEGSWEMGVWSDENASAF